MPSPLPGRKRPFFQDSREARPMFSHNDTRKWAQRKCHLLLFIRAADTAGDRIGGGEPGNRPVKIANKDDDLFLMLSSDSGPAAADSEGPTTEGCHKSRQLWSVKGQVVTQSLPEELPLAEPSRAWDRTPCEGLPVSSGTLRTPAVWLVTFLRVGAGGVCGPEICVAEPHPGSALGQGVRAAPRGDGGRGGGGVPCVPGSLSWAGKGYEAELSGWAACRLAVHEAAADTSASRAGPPGSGQRGQLL